MNEATERGLGRRLQAMVQSPEFTTDLLQIVKCTVAATAAWWFATAVLDSALPFLAPWTALLTVHATVYRSFSHGAQTTVASGLGVLLSFLIGNYLGVGLWTFALALLVGMAASRIAWIRDEGVAIATTAIFVLGSGFEGQESLLIDRLIEVGVGVGVGAIANLLIIPPLRDKQASRYVDSINRRMGTVLMEMGDEFSGSRGLDRAEEWFKETESMEAELESAWQTVRFARESGWGNPRRHLPAQLRSRHESQHADPQGQQVGYEEILLRADEGISHLRNLTRTLREASYTEGPWDTHFRDQWARIVHDTGRAISDPDAEVDPVRDRLGNLAVRLSGTDELPQESWPVYGSLITSMQHIAVMVDDVVSAREAREATPERPEA